MTKKVGMIGEGKVSILEKLARAIEPSTSALTEVRPEAKSVARRIKPLKEIEGAEKVRIGGKPRPTNGHVTMLDGQKQLFYTDGSLRYPGGKPKKEPKRQRRHTLRFGCAL